MSADDSTDRGRSTRALSPTNYTTASENTRDFLTGRNNESESEHQSALLSNDVQSHDKVNKRNNKSFSNPDDEKKALKKQIKQLQGTIASKEVDFHKLMSLNTELEKYNASLRKRVESLEKHADTLEKQVETLAKQKEQFKEEASRYQSALGDATSHVFKEDDPNNPIFLKRHIQALEKKLDNIARTKGATITIEPSEESTKLVNRYLHPYKIQEGDVDKVLLKAALQRMIIEEILKKTAVAQKKESTLEFGIAQTTETLCSMIAQFISDNKISDNIADLVPDKIRQQTYSLLGTHAFTDANHPFIKKNSKEMLDVLDRYRTNKKDEQEKLSQTNEMIRTLIRVLYFRPKVFANAKIEFAESGVEFDDALMRGAQLDEDDAEESALVALCSLPMVYKEQKKEGNIIYGKAKVSLRKENDERFELKADNEVEEEGDSKSEFGEESYVEIQSESGNHKNGTQDPSANVQTTNGNSGTQWPHADPNETKPPRSTKKSEGKGSIMKRFKRFIIRVSKK